MKYRDSLYTLIRFAKFMYMSNPLPYQDIEHFHHSKKFSHAPSQTIPITEANTDLISIILA